MMINFITNCISPVLTNPNQNAGHYEETKQKWVCT